SSPVYQLVVIVPRFARLAFCLHLSSPSLLLAQQRARQVLDDYAIIPSRNRWLAAQATARAVIRYRRALRELYRATCLRPLWFTKSHGDAQPLLARGRLEVTSRQFTRSRAGTWHRSYARRHHEQRSARPDRWRRSHRSRR